MTLFVFRPQSCSEDEAEKLAHNFAEEMLASVKDEVIDLSCFKGNTAKFKETLKGFGDKAYFAAYCHGSPNAVYIRGEGDKSIELTDAHLLKNKSCYLVSCHSVTGLGKAAKEAGASGVVGYSRNLWLALVGIEDLEAVRRCVNSGIIHWLNKGGTAKEVYDIIREAYLNELKKLDFVKTCDQQQVWLYGVLRANLASLDFL